MTDREPEAAGYPTHWEADVLTADGSVARIRPVHRDDTEALRAMHARMSDRSRYLRYFSAVTEVSDALLALFTDVDYRTRVCLVVQSGDDIIAAGSYHALPAGDSDADVLAPAALDQPAAAQRRADPAMPSARSAEVAFVVQDDQQRRGLGSILLEHLAAAAQERGITSFTAEVLGENRQMLRVFLDAGYAVTREYSSGVVDLAFEIGPTDASRAVLAAREQRAESRSIARLLAPASVAVIGASTDPTKIGHAVLVNLLRSFAGPVYPVNAESLSVQGVRAYPSVTDIPDPVDLAVVAVPAASVDEVMRACRAKGVHGLVVVTAGFADAGSDGAGAQRRIVSLARAAGMRVLGPNCLGLVNTDPAVRLNATLAPVVPPAGRVGFFCQSGALGIAILADAAARGLGLSSFVSAGNRADVSGNDLLQFWQTDDRTEVVLLQLESFGNPRKFARLARTLARSKPVIAVKSGRHALVPAGLRVNAAPISEAAVASLFAQSGVIRTATLSDAFDVALLLACQPVPADRTVAIVGNSTALGLLALDACLDAGLRVAGDAPVDLGVSVGPQELAGAVRNAAGSGVGAVLVVFVPPVATAGTEHAAALRAATGDVTVPVLSTFLAAEGIPDQLAVPGARGGAASDPTAGAARGSVPSYPSPERAVAALAAAWRYADWLATPPGRVRVPDGVDPARARELVAALHPAGGERALTDAELAALLGCYGITVDNSEPVAEAAVSTEFSVTADPSFGSLVSFGIGGVAIELLDDRAYRAVPLTDLDAAGLIGAPRAAPLLDGYRGTPAVDRAPLVDLAQRLSALADDLPEVRLLQLRPVLAGPAGIVVTGATGRIGPPPAPLDERRRLR